MNLKMMAHTARAAWGRGDANSYLGPRLLLAASVQNWAPGEAQVTGNQGPARYRAAGVVLVVQQRVPQEPVHVRVAGRPLEVGGSELGEGVLGQLVRVLPGLFQHGDRIQVHLWQLLRLCFQILGAVRGRDQHQLSVQMPPGEACISGPREPQEGSVWLHTEHRAVCVPLMLEPPSPLSGQLVAAMHRRVPNVHVSAT